MNIHSTYRGSAVRALVLAALTAGALAAASGAGRPWLAARGPPQAAPPADGRVFPGFRQRWSRTLAVSAPHPPKGPPP
jgi:hypothetical protein